MTASYGFLIRRMALPSPKARFDAGIRYGRKHWDFDIGYRLEEPIRDRTDARLHVLYVGLSTEVDLRKDD